jgi:hypothetical protein
MKNRALELEERRTGPIHTKQVDLAKLVKVARENPEVTWKDLGARFGISAGHAHRIGRQAGITGRRE